MMRTLALFTFLAFAGTVTGQVIQLQHGQVLVGEVQDATADGLTFRRLDNGGTLSLEWSDLTPTSAEKVRRLKGLLVEDENDPTVMADVIEYVLAGGIRDEFVGRIEEETSDAFRIRRKGDVVEIKRRSIKNRTKREVPILEVYTQESYYQEQLAKIDPKRDADKHIQLADEMRRVGNFDRAKEHLLRAQELGTGNQQSLIPGMLAKLETLAAASAERGLLSKIRQSRNRKNFTRAKELIEEFRETFPDSELLAELEREERRFERDRERFLVDSMRNRWERFLRAVSTDKLNEPKLTFGMVRDYVESRMAEDVFEHAAKSLGIEAGEANELWHNRAKYGSGHAAVFSYGTGSWVLGAEEILKDTNVQEKLNSQQEPQNSEDPELKRILRMIREHKKRQRQIARQNKGEGAEDETWWRAMTLGQKRNWMRAYFAEYGGVMEVTSAMATPCVNCGGVGTVQAIGANGRPIKEPCEVCHGTRYYRKIRAR